MISTLIIDDEPLAIKGLEVYAEKVDFINVVKTCQNAIDAKKILDSQPVDLIFLDIQMPHISGLDLLKSMKDRPMVIITSAFPEYAMEGYELDVIDYILKPISFERFQKGCNKAFEYFNYTKKIQTDTKAKDHLFIKADKRIEKVYFNDILYVEGLKNYIAVHTKDRTIITHLTLKSMEEALPQGLFLKIQKSFVVAIDKISAVENDTVIVNKKHLPISRANKDEILKKILGNNFLKS